MAIAGDVPLSSCGAGPPSLRAISTHEKLGKRPTLSEKRNGLRIKLETAGGLRDQPSSEDLEGPSGRAPRQCRCSLFETYPCKPLQTVPMTASNKAPTKALSVCWRDNCRKVSNLANNSET